MSLIDFFLVLISACSWEFWVSSSAKCGRYYSRVLLRTIGKVASANVLKMQKA